MGDDMQKKQEFSMAEAVDFIRKQQETISPGMKAILDHNRALRDARRTPTSPPPPKKNG